MRLPAISFVVASLYASVAGGGSQDTAPARKVPAQGKWPDVTIEWRPIFKGIEYASAGVSEPRPMKAHALRVDLRDPEIDFLVTPANGDRPAETDGLKTSTFLEKHKCQVAINASPFRPVGLKEGEPKDVLGLSVSRGDRYSEPESGYGALVIDKHRKVRIVKPGGDTRGARNAVGGFRMLLQEGKNVGGKGAVHPRTAVGVSRDGRYLLILVVDGRQRGYSEGATTAETAEWLRALGAHSGLNLDGGGSSTLVVEDEEKGFRLLNRPIHAGVPGTERVNGNHLGIFAGKLPGPSTGS